MRNEKYIYKDYLHMSTEEKKLWKQYKAAADEDEKTETLAKIKEIRGVYTTKHEDDKITESVSEMKFVKYLLTIFSVIYINGNIALYNYKLHHYEFIDIPIFLGFCKKLLDSMDGKFWNSKLENKYKTRFMRDVPIKLKEFKIPEDYVVFQNGCLKLSTGEFFPGDHPNDIYNLCCTGYEYDALAKCPAFEKFINDVFNQKAGIIANAQEMSGNTLNYGCNPMQVITILLGRGRNGKGVFTNVIQKVHGEKNCSATSVSQLTSQFGLGQLYDKVLNISNENDENVVTDTSVLKNISGNDIVEVNKKYKDPMPVRIFCKLWISTNDIVFKDTSKGFEERLVPLPFKNTYVVDPRPGTSERLRDNDLEKKLSEELPGIFNWMYEGYIRLRKNKWKITPCEEITKLRDQLVEASNPVQLFVNVMIEKCEGATTKKPDTYRRFKAWTSANDINVSSYISAQKFYPKFEAIMNSKGYKTTTKRVRGEVYYCDFTINDSNDLV